MGWTQVWAGHRYGGNRGMPQLRHAAPVVDGAAKRHQEGGHQLRQRLLVGRALPAGRVVLQPLHVAPQQPCQGLRGTCRLSCTRGPANCASLLTCFQHRLAATHPHRYGLSQKHVSNTSAQPAHHLARFEQTSPPNSVHAPPLAMMTIFAM